MFRRLLAVLKKNRKVQALAAVLAVMAVANLLFYSVLGAPAALERSGLESSLEEADARLASADKGREDYEKFMAGLRDLERFKEKLPARAGYTALLTDVYKMAKNDGMKFPSYGASVSGVDKAGGVEHVTFSLPVSGSYEDVRRFIYDVETSDLFLDIDGLGLNNSGEDSIDLSIGISTYVR